MKPKNRCEGDALLDMIDGMSEGMEKDPDILRTAPEPIGELMFNMIMAEREEKGMPCWGWKGYSKEEERS